jgi:F-type H+-transporting ATPase subunit epsilon
MSTIQVNILTPDGSKYNGEAEGIIVPGVLGSFEVKHNHAPIVSTLEVGPVQLKTNKKTIPYAISGGTIEVNANVVSLIVETAESLDEIDKARAEEAKERAIANLNDSDKDAIRAKRALARAENRLKLLLASK